MLQKSAKNLIFCSTSNLSGKTEKNTKKAIKKTDELTGMAILDQQSKLQGEFQTSP